jgi:hypothetical protein
VAGSSSSFDAGKFRGAIEAAMDMGAPPDPARRPVFVFPSSGRGYVKNGAPVLNPVLDMDGRPLDPGVRVVDVPGDQVSVPCAVQIMKADAEEIPVGNFRPTKAIVTMLDLAHAMVQGCREMIYNGDRYVFGYEPEALGMFEVGVFVMVFYAAGES